jgi:hypothetical protein
MFCFVFILWLERFLPGSRQRWKGRGQESERRRRAQARKDTWLIGEVKLTDFGAAKPSSGLSKEDERSAALAARAQRGDYDDGRIYTHFQVPDEKFP